MTEIPLLSGGRKDSTQWRAECLQMANWGGFEGHTSVDLAPHSTLISGASGTGKSTLLDAYIALMMPSDVPFNGASNDATTGRARGVDQRSILSYLRGKRDAARDDDSGSSTDDVLRGRDTAVWGAVAMTFINDNGERFTALRAYYAPRAAQRWSEVQLRMGTLDGGFDLRDLQDVAESRFGKREMAARFPGMRPFDTYGQFSQTLFTRLGIGAGGDGEKALRLLARIQMGYRVKTVDGLYKQMVLETPATYALADQALSHFSDLDESYRDMETDEAKVKILERIPTLYSDYQNAIAEAQRIDRFGLGRDGDTPFLVWSLCTEDDLLDTSVRVNRRVHLEEDAKYRTARGETKGLKKRLEEVKEKRRTNGGSALDAVKVRLTGLQLQREDMVRDRARFEGRVSALNASFDNQESYNEVRDAAQHFLAQRELAESDLAKERDRLVTAKVPLDQALKDLLTEYNSLKQRQNLVPVKHHEARMTVAQACGLRAEDLPFAAELMDVDPDFESWRHACEVALRPVALTMLMDARQQQEIRRTIDGLTLPLRLNFDGVDLDDRAQTPADHTMISGRLRFKEESPFVHWVKRRVTARSVDHCCVDSPSELGGSNPKVTVNGQTSQGRRGAHGWNPNHKPVLGFSNKARLAEIQDQARHVSDQIKTTEEGLKTVEERQTTLRVRSEAYWVVLDTSWTSIDITSLEAEIAETETERDRLLRNSDVLAELERQENMLSTSLDAATKRANLAESHCETLDKEHLKLADRQDAVKNEMLRIEQNAAVVLVDEDNAYLTGRLRDDDPDLGLDGLKLALARLRRTLLDNGKSARDKARSRQDLLTRTFESFLQRWPNPNIGTGIESYQDFQDIFDHIQHQGLYEKKRKWKRKLAKWSGEDLTSLNTAFDTSIEDIEERLLPVNDILADLDFGAERDRLRINLRRLYRDDISKFRKELKHLSSNTTIDLTDEQTEERFKRLRTFMKHLAKGEGGSASRRDDMLDVRRHIEITAARINRVGREVSTYSALGGKSGGETQELVAFIVGAALRFQLGDEARSRPRFAPVFLDEGFVKADSKFAGRAVRAWQGLGFQLIIGAPLDKVTALEPHMDLLLGVTKNAAIGYSYIRPVQDFEEMAESRVAS
ncbi:MAG: ATP-binding protein [Pseudonocardiaceae bacterium]